MTNHSTLTLPIVVAIDGSPVSEEAVRWAADEAARRGTTLHVVHAFTYAHAPGGYVGTYDPEAPARVSEAMCQRAVAIAQDAHPDLAVTTEVRVGRAAPELVKASDHAAMMVLGSRGHGRLTGVIVGSVSQQVATHAHCPVVVVREKDEKAATSVVVGVDGSPAAARALLFAAEHAAASGASVRAIRSEYVEIPVGAPDGNWYGALVEHVARATEEARRTVEEVAAELPDVDIELRVVREHPETALVEASAEAEMLVVASRGLGGFAGLMLGSVSQGVLSRAKVTVAVVPAGVEVEHPDIPHAG